MEMQLFMFLIWTTLILALLGLGGIIEAAFFRGRNPRREENELQNWWVQQDQDDQWIDSQQIEER